VIDHKGKTQKWVSRLLRPFADREVLRTILDDFDYRARYDLKNHGVIRTGASQFFHFLVIFFSLVLESFFWSLTMFKNYVKTGFRNLKKHKAFSFISVFGLAVGLSCCLLITLYVKNELSYDRFHKNAKNIYRVIMNQSWNPWQGKTLWNVTPGAAAAALEQDFPEVIRSSRVVSRRASVSVADKVFYETGFLYVDSDFLEIFNFPLASGNRKTVLNEPFSLLLTKEMSEKYFGNEDPVGKVLNINNSHEYRVVGVLKNSPENSHLSFNFVTSMRSLLSIKGNERYDKWRPNWTRTYIQLQDGFDPGILQAKLPAFIKKYRDGDTENEFILQPLIRIHLHSTKIHDIVRGDIKHIYFLSAIALIIMLIACFNYMNLATARASTRFKEVGLRKVVGADKKSLVRQFLGESISFSVLAFFMALVFARLFLPVFNTLINRNLSFNTFFDGLTILFIAGLVVMIGIVSGSYPAVYLSSFQPSSILQDKHSSRAKGAVRLRNILVVFQFSLSITLISCTLIVKTQLDFMRNKDLGFNKEEILNVVLREPKLIRDSETFRNILLQHSGIKDILVTQSLPTTISSNNVYKNPSWAGKTAAPEFYVNFGWVGYRFIDFYGIELLQGRNFSREYATDKEACIINETAARIIGWEDPVGKVMDDFPVIGVVKDFHFRPLKDKIEPVALRLNRPGRPKYFSIKIYSDRLEKTITFIEKKWKEASPDYPFSFFFLDEQVDRTFRAEVRLLKIFNNFSFLAILLSSLGLFGLALFTADRKTKEIGIRKVLGASVPQILVLLSREFVRWILLANLIAWPLAYLSMNKWLDSFAYKTNMSVAMFIMAGLIALCVSILTVSYQSLKAAKANPVDSLRYE
jgi:putative ABC transport system permease protein